MDKIEQKMNFDPVKLSTQLREFRDRQGEFSRPLALASVKSDPPDEWWRLFGGDVPELQSFAIRILSQTTSSSGCERNWSVFERIHTKRRNRLEYQRLNDLVYVHYNLLLQNRANQKNKSYYPVDYESIDKTGFWVMDEEPGGELDYDELENMIDEEPPHNFEPSTSQNNEFEGMEMGILLK
ncbi:uncharacterized protein LOC118482061 isoform X2 [Helianthus annuus]|uniref:uncharacterized protein LOC118482061 isoform X2 n=1 Tax=Helianthus annuus TaxID=4232 RepID=UPI00165324F8|nr:uncharacterized protein LOC118482061 isoform X2 [Helianthus annuus]